jgi:hypothetical protein
LIITGLGATALETRSASINVHAVPLAGRSIAPAPQPQPGNPQQQQQPEMAAVDLDIPAFMRRRIR